ncbi:MAG: hypothetical protein KC468_24465 [Myxococcales bacterium]|nr:hypothetical protein [Myxococcales bacterium]
MRGRIGAVGLLWIISTGCVVANPDYVPPLEGESDVGDETSAGTTIAPTGTSTDAMTTGASMTATASGSSSPATTEGATSTTSAGSSTGTGLCEGPSVDVVVDPPDIMFIVDKSRSMFTREWQGQNGLEPRWAGVHAALDGALLDLQEEVFAGLVLSPQAMPIANSWSVCSINPEPPDVLPLQLAHDPIVDALPPASPVIHTLYSSAGNPLTAAIEAATATLAQFQGTWAQFIVVLTDGAPNCAAEQEGNNPGPGLTTPDPSAVDAVIEARGSGIFTLMVGVDVQAELPDALLPWEPDVDPFELLTAMAIAGGLAQPEPDVFFNAQTASQLAVALGALERLGYCVLPALPEYAIELGVDDLDSVMIEVAGDPYFAVDSCPDEDGFVVVTSGAYTFVILCGLACDDSVESGGELVAVACE